MSIGTGVWYNGDYTMVVMSLLSRRKIHVHGVSKGPIQKRVEGKMVLSCPPQLSWEGKREWGWTLGTYIYTMEMGDDASTMVQLRKNNILLNYLSFLSRKITTMPYLPVWWASFNEWTEWYTSLHNSFWWGVSEIHSPSYSYTARRMLVVYSLKHDDMPRCDGL